MPLPRSPDRIIPQPIQGEVKVQVQLPDEALALLRDLHEDRQTIAGGLVWLLVLASMVVVRYVVGRKST